ncbi:MAG: 1-(5-phosphoribosyl)-5-[(5-phosphoribosylamino)methylideneamino]imidazole-4-carboxamide isomerase [Actinomycetota bacterium]
MILYPAIDLRDGHAVRLTQGDYERETVYDADPLDAARRWAEGGARWLHAVDLDGARDGTQANLASIERIAAAVDVPVQAGGGLRSIEAVQALLDAGVERAVIGTAALRDPELLAAALERHGERIVVSVDARGGRVSLSGWTETSDVDAADALAELSERGVARFVFTSIEVDGTMEGPGLEELRRIAVATEAELIYSGGVGGLDDLRALASQAPANVGGVIVGRALYEGRFTIEQGQAALA